jgi:triphosphoribosyl-dephospho-CoA synthase
MLNNNSIHKAVVWACQQEVSAPKPGNVNCFSDGHQMSVQDFIKSAHAIAPVLSQDHLSVGSMILQSVMATRQVVDCNTNLGIILLFAPLCKAIHDCHNIEQLPKSLQSVLENLTVDDAIKAYEGIRLAQAGGLGKSEQQDVNTEPTVTLRKAMEYARDKDSIAAQYLNNYHEILDLGLTNLTLSINCGESVEWASAFAYLKLLSAMPDSLISRKQGLTCANAVMNESQIFVQKMSGNNKLSQFKVDIISWDKELKQKAINPGTTADMTAATLLVYAFEQALS